MSAANAHQAKRVMNVDCLSSVCLNLLDSYPRIKALHFHQKYVASLQGNDTNVEIFFHIRRGIEILCSCSRSYTLAANCFFAAGAAARRYRAEAPKKLCPSFVMLSFVYRRFFCQGDFFAPGRLLGILYSCTLHPLALMEFVRKRTNGIS